MVNNGLGEHTASLIGMRQPLPAYQAAE